MSVRAGQSSGTVGNNAKIKMFQKETTTETKCSKWTPENV